MRATVYNIPCTQDMIKNSQIPIGLVISPFAELKPTEVGLMTVPPCNVETFKGYMPKYGTLHITI